MTIEIMNAAGQHKTPEAVARLAHYAREAHVPLREITIGSFTRLPREGNKGNTFAPARNGHAHLNALGLPNGGIDYVVRHADDFLKAAGGIPLRVSIAPIERDDLRDMVTELRGCGFRTLEINLGCPNVWSDSGTQKAIISHDYEAFMRACREVVEAALAVDGAIERTAVKFSPLYPHDIPRMAEIVAMDIDLDEVVTMNTTPNGLSFTDDTPVLSTTFGGVSGAGTLPIAVGQVKMFRDALNEHGARGRRVILTGVGGIDSGHALREHKLAGADMCQVGTHLFVHGPKVLGDIYAEYLALSEEEEV